MIVVHATWSGGALCLWAEDSTLPPTTRSREARKPHPFAMPSGALATALWDLGPVVADVAAKGAEAELVLTLPGSPNRPQSSPELGRAPARAALHDWTVPVVCIGPADALEFLAVLPESGDDEIVLGTDLRYLVEVAADAVDLANRGRLLPTLITEDGLYMARWAPVVAGVQARRFRAVAEAMPPICRAAGTPAAELLLDALAALADAYVRRVVTPVAPRSTRRRPTFTDRWVDALYSNDPRAEAGDDEAEADHLAGELEEWFTAAHRLAGAATVSFRLEEPGDRPGGGEDGWFVHFSLQAADDPSLMLPAAKVWAGESLPGVPGGSDEALLTGLGRAARLWPDLAVALREASPAGRPLDTAGAFAFLKQTAPLLRAAGFGVMVPAWAGKSRLGIKLTSRSAAPANGGTTGAGFGLAEIVDFRWDLALGDDVIDADVLAELARLKVPLVRLRGTWVELDDHQLTAALDFLARGGRSGTMPAADVLGAVIRGGTDDLPLLDVDADGRLGDLLSGEADRRLERLPAPDGFRGTLRPYQERGFAWLNFLGDLGLGAVLADSMGLGKTPTVLALLSRHRGGKPALVVCPMSLVGNWEREATKFAPSLRVYVHHGAERQRGEDLAAAVGDADLVITTYGTALRDIEHLGEVEWGRVVCDEAQAIKNAGTRQAKAVRALRADARVAMTGTPVENHLGELWSIMEFANPGLLGSQAEFRRRLAAPIEREGDEEATTALRRATQPFILRRLKTDKSIISDLPEKLEMTAYVNLTREQASLYQAVVEEMMERIESAEEGIERKGLVLATMAKLKQVCNHPAHLLKDGSALAGRSGKLARLEEMLEELLEAGDKALCFTQYSEFGAMLQPYLAARLGRPVLWLHGGTVKKQRDALVERFQTEEGPGVFLLSLKAAGTGLNLTAANHVIHVDRWWNPAVEDQATDRAFRIGQTKNVQVHKYVCVGTVEERIDKMITNKKALAESVVGTGEDWLTELSVAELRDVIGLSPEAVSA